MDIEKYRSISLLGIVYSRIKDDILKGKYKPGERLVVKKISQELGVSHTPINESLNRLVIEGYVEFIPRKGMKVREIDLEEIKDTYEIRKMIELYCAEYTILKAKEDSAYIDEIKGFSNMISSGCYKDAYQDQFNAFFENESQFHLKQVSACNNNKLISLYENLKANTMFYNKIVCSDMLLTEARYNESISEHSSIVEAIVKYDIDLLKSCLSAHIENAIGYIIDSSKLTSERAGGN
ncbi:MAG: GntR family transcriptional regulator [Christensenellales bacterium]